MKISGREKKISIKELFRGKVIKLGIKEIICATQPDKKFSKFKIRLISRITSSISKKDDPTIAIITQAVSRRLCMMPESLYKQQVFENIFKKNNLLILANSLSIPASFKEFTLNKNIAIAASKHDEYYLRSLLKTMIREKYQEAISVHGVALETKGKGVLITGASGIGKTTAALNVIDKDKYWIADDFIIIKRNKLGELEACGHKKIQNYIHTEATGIMPAEQLLDPNRIKKKMKLYAIVEVERNGIKHTKIIRGEKKILDIKLICFHINIPFSDYLNDQSLKRVLEQLSKENQ